MSFPPQKESVQIEDVLEPNAGPFSIEKSRLKETRKRKRELLFIVLIALAIVALTVFEIHLFGISQKLPFEHSIFFFGLVNFNIVLLLLLLFLIFRNVVKVYVERKNKIFGSSLKSKLVVSFAAFSFVPTFLIFLISVFYINSSFDKWFSVKTSAVLKGALEVTQSYYFNSTKRNYHFAHLIAEKLNTRGSDHEVSKQLESMLKTYSLDAIEFYPKLSRRIAVAAEQEAIPDIPKASLEFLKKGFVQKIEASTIHTFAEGNLVRVIVPSASGAVIVSSYLPLSLTSKIDDISEVYKEFRESNPLEYPLKSIYMIVLAMMTLVIFLAATWFGFHLARQLSTPLVQLGRATRRVAGGDYTPVQISSGSDEISQLVESFNSMTVNLAQSEREVEQASESLRQTLSDLDRYSQYIAVVLRNVSAGVVSVDQSGKLVTMNKRAGELLGVEPEKFVGRSVRDLLTGEYLRTFGEILKSMQESGIEQMQKELRINRQGEAVPLLMTLSLLRDETGSDLGKVLVFDDLTAIVNAQRAQAWTEVARRIAHEIKNPLTPIRLSAERLQRKFGALISDPAFSECTSMIVNQTEELKNLVNEFSQFARLPEAKPVLGSLTESVRKTLSIYRTSHSQIDFQELLDPNLPEFKFDPDQIHRVLVNLIDNSIHALEGQASGAIEVSTEYSEDFRTVRISIQDNGCGIPLPQRARIFEPYFSTKKGGTGLGLAIVRRIVEDHNGFIRATSGEGERGTKMIIELPVNEVGAWKPIERSDRSSAWSDQKKS